MDGKFQCQICRKSLSTKTSLRNHIYIHTGEKYDKCHLCPKSFHDPFTLRKHIKTHSSRKKLYKCTSSSACRKAFTTPYILNKHIQSPHGKLTPIPQYNCKICKRKLSDKSNFQRHLKLHSKEKSHGCEYTSCNRKFTHKGDLQVHIRAVHTKEKPYKCKRCRKRFISSSHLNVHLRHVHPHSRSKLHPQPPRRHGCLFCSKSFVSGEDLQKHVRIHTKEKPYFCSICDAEFSQAGSRKEHEKTHHRRKKEADRKLSLVQVIKID